MHRPCRLARRRARPALPAWRLPPAACAVRWRSDTSTLPTSSQLRYLDEAELKSLHARLESSPDLVTPPWREFKASWEAAATPVDRRVRPIYGTLTLSFVAQGIQFPVLPQLARSLELGTADLGLIAATTALARLVSNAPAAAAAERFGRRPLLIAGPATAAVGMGLLACSDCFWHMVVANTCLGAGLATTTTAAQLYLADISTPRNRAATTAPLLQSALIGFAVGPAVGGVLAQHLGFSLPFAACATGLLGSFREASQPFPTGAFPVTLVLFATENVGMDSASVGGMLTANVALMVLLTAPATRLSDAARSRKSIMVPALAAAAVCTGLQSLAATPWSYAALVGLGGSASAFSMPSISPIILDSVAEEERARALAGRQMVQDSGALLGASGMGLVASVLGIPAAMQTVAALQLASVAIFALRVPSRPAEALRECEARRRREQRRDQSAARGRGD
ncbi:hypothetical protein EMIHUDRAFT_214474 [Emiliania huxleyi CCMP1516]|uniref:Major facilitator superfamily (MFS) profile domain-containing protein n=2 Tax=Emiliania huxleyi TaxID=2903 RepID=A0A0D3IK32_EMIH1|nr:hypothetical protein EMIHUDRAFT_214474 [Emiliania huxleyi CCMP1516]EOD11617.1 hypothetical protein EMIHUDRAFT_214474 [Emiliania huxleyi CCMP1516]|eukprot:XP_005764046.1 hypothetical protein EMIHUDRAFT_214474 [Emiliania huxleyi CCMP1516]